MSAELQQQLQRALGDGYVFERELGGGGMSRVFVARDTQLERRIVVKVLPPELSASVSVDRFRREIQLAAGLQHPHIVPVLAAGVSDGLPYFTMPFVDGESLRARLTREHELPVGDTVGILRDVSKALAYAHARGIVHRDIKPDNVLLSGGAAVVTDFGVAKALSDSAREGSSNLTSLGMAMGTPAYMAPEQAAADPETDHRADIYALGAMAYEMLTGRPLFPGRSPQQVLAAHTMQTPDPVSQLRPSLPPALSALVMRCLEKHPADRPQTADEVLLALESLATPSGGIAPAMTAATRALLAPKGGRIRFARALAAYVGASLIVVAFAALLVQTIGVPDWVLPGAAIVMALGLPMVLVTGLVQYRAAQGAPPSAIPGAQHLFTWRRTMMGGAAALGIFGVLVVAWLVTRALGIGPARSLVAAGVLKDRESILIDDFRGPPNDSMLGAVVTSAFRTDLGQSQVVSVVQPVRVAAALRRMQRPASSTLDLALAREVALRDGIKAVLDGDVSMVGPTFVLSVRLISADSGAELAAFRETADDAKEVIPAVDRLSKKLRGKIGESLRTVRDSKPLEQVTTGSLEALRRYASAERAIMVEGDNVKGLALLQEAVALDTSFAMAYRKLGVVLGNTGAPPEQRLAALEKAYAHRDRLTDVERYLTIGTYYMSGPTLDPSKALAAYDALLDIQPDNTAALNNAALMLSQQGNYTKAVAYASRAITADSTNLLPYGNLAVAQYELGRRNDAFKTLALVRRRNPSYMGAEAAGAQFYMADGDYDSVMAIIARTRVAFRGDISVQSGVEDALESIARARGQLVDAARHTAAAVEINRQRGYASADLLGEMQLALYDGWYRGQPERGAQRLDAALARYPLSAIPTLQRPYIFLALMYANFGRPEKARALLAEQQRMLPPGQLQAAEYDRHSVMGEIALAERNAELAKTEFRASDRGDCAICPLPGLVRAFLIAGQPDSAIAAGEKYLETQSIVHGNFDPIYRAALYRRLGELYEARGDTSRAASSYARFIEAWKDADPDLQARVADARRRLQALKRNEGS